MPISSIRLTRAIQALAEHSVDAILLTPGADLQYLTGFTHGHAYERLLALVLRRDGSGRWIIPTMNAEQVRPHAMPGQAIVAWTDQETYLPALADALRGASSVAFDDEARAGFLMDLLGTAPGATIKRASMITRPLRLRKDAAEIAGLRAAADTVDQTIPQAIALCQVGQTEAQIDEKLRAALVQRAPDQSVAFTIIASGPNAATPHHETARRAIEPGDVVIVDFGTREPGGYQSDITITCSAGEPRDPEARKVYATVYNAQQAAIAAIRPGVTCEAIDRAARSVIEDAGYGQYFIHRTGHGLGLQGHEAPYIVGGNTQLLEEGMVFSIEPGIYLPGRFGVRLEVIVAVGTNGAIMINQPSRPELPMAR